MKMLFHCRSKLAITALTALLAPAVWAAGSHDGGHDHGHDMAAIGKPGEASEASRTIEVTMYDNYYEPERISVEKGETVRFVVSNEGVLVHEFSIGTAAMHAAHQKEMQMMVEHGVLEPDNINESRMKMDMGDGHTMEHDDPNSVLLEPGETASLVWTFTQASDLEFACNVPGHYASGMVGPIQID
jgi:uncharacterized cupredoxin-like copper-binding protein